jgi:serine/threonine-protein kinase
MEYVDGCNLKSLIERQKQKGRRIEIAHTIYIAMECCKALNYAHSLEHPETNEPLGIVHRDISPPNILLSKNGEIKLVDFGLAKANSQIESTDPGVVKGKFSYLSPEAASAQPVDHRADIFAVGILLWEMFTGRRLFYGETDYQTVELVRQARIPSIAALNPEIEPELEAIVRKALAREADDRYQSAADLADALAQYLFSRKMKVTSRDIQTLVRDTQLEQMRKRSAEPKESLIDTLINDEIGKMTSLVEDENPEQPQTAEGSMSLDPGLFVDTSNWSGELASQKQPAYKRPTRPPPMSTGKQRIAGHQTPNPGEIASLEQMLEGGDRTGVHGKAEKKTNWMLIIIVMLVLAGGAAAAVVMLMK